MEYIYIIKLSEKFEKSVKPSESYKVSDNREEAMSIYKRAFINWKGEAQCVRVSKSAFFRACVTFTAESIAKSPQLASPTNFLEDPEEEKAAEEERELNK